VANGVDAATATAGENQIIAKLARACYFSNVGIGRQADKEFAACKRPFGKSALADLQELQREGASFSPLFFVQARRHNSRVSAAKLMPLADNFLQKQQKQRSGRQFPQLASCGSRRRCCPGNGNGRRSGRRGPDHAGRSTSRR
jgi:hypothetical protein